MFADRVKETSATTGTGSFDLGGAISGFATFLDSFESSGLCYYCAELAGEWEVGVGIVTSGTPDTLSRDRIIASSNSGAKVNFSAGTKTIFNALTSITALNSDSRHRVRAATTSNITLQDVQTVDDISLLNNETCLVKNQNTASENGPYTVKAGSVPWERLSDFDTGIEVSGVFFSVNEGTVNNNTLWRVDGASVIVDTDDIDFLRINKVGYTSLNDSPATTLTIASGVVTITGRNPFRVHNIDTEASASSDILDSISGGDSGDSIILKLLNGAREVTITHGTIKLQGGKDRLLAEDYNTLTLINIAGTWYETASSDTLVLADNAVPKADGTGGRIQGSGLLIDDNDRLTFKSSVSQFNVASYADPLDFDLNLSNKHEVVLAGNPVLSLSNIVTSMAFVIILKQDATGSRTVTWWSGIKWPNASVPTLTTTVNKTDVFGFLCTGAGEYLGFAIGRNL